MNKYLQELQNSEYVRDKDLGNGIHSYNYTNKAFYNQAWNSVTEKARGFFANPETEQVVARSFDKFFAIDERPETKMDSLRDTLQFPVAVYEKYNGFLGIISYDENSKNKLFVASKSTNKGEFATYFRDILDDITDDAWQLTFAGYLKSLNASAVFEVIDPFHNPHIVKYNEPQIVLLALIRNDWTFQKFSYDIFVKETGRMFNLKIKRCATILHNWDEFVEFLEKAKSEKEIEGYVFEDNADMMLKYKTEWYKFWKRIRTVGHAIWNNKYTRAQIKQKYHIGDYLLDFLYDYVFDAKQNELDADVMDNIPVIRERYLERVLPEVER